MARQLSFFPQWSPPPEPGNPTGGAVPVGEERGIAFFDLPCRSVLNRCTSHRMPFPWTINPYRGCEFGCTYCYARYSHEFLGMEEWTDFQEKILVKRNAPERLSRDLDRLHLPGGAIAMGTVTDPYQPAEKRFGVTRRILEVLVKKRGLDLSITTKSSLITRDIGLLGEIAERSRLSLNVSLITLDRRIARILEPRAPTPALRLKTIRSLAEAGLRVGVFAMPVMPGLTDSPRGLESLVRRSAEAGAKHFSAQVVFLRDSARKGFLPRLEKDFPDLARRYRRECGRAGYFSRPTQEAIRTRIAALKAKYGFGAATPPGPCSSLSASPSPHRTFLNHPGQGVTAWKAGAGSPSPAPPSPRHSSQGWPP